VTLYEPHNDFSKFFVTIWQWWKR